LYIVVGSVTTLRTDYRGSRFNSQQDKRLSYFQNIHSGFGAHTAF